MNTAQVYFEHNHQQCIEDALHYARALCKSRGARFTRLREQVFTLIWHSHKPLGAYAILEELSDKHQRRPAPPTVYRALDFLRDQGLVHRIASLNAFIGCNHPRSSHCGQFLICRNCDITLELDHTDLPESMIREAQANGFATESAVIEVMGLCPNCRSEASAL